MNRYALALVLVLLGTTWAQKTQSRIYSNVYYNEEGGDLLGVELEASFDSGRIKGQLKFYEGACAQPIDVSGLLTGEKINVSGSSDSYGKIELSGKIHKEVLNGSLRLEKAASIKKVISDASRNHTASCVYRMIPSRFRSIHESPKDCA